MFNYKLLPSVEARVLLQTGGGAVYTHSDYRMSRTSRPLYLYTHSDHRMTRTSCLLYLYTHSDCRMTRTSCICIPIVTLLYLYTHSDCRMTIINSRQFLNLILSVVYSVTSQGPDTVVFIDSPTTSR